MKSRTSFFNKTVFLKNTTRFWPVWAAYLGIWLLIMPFQINNEFSYKVSESAVTYNVLNLGNIGGIVMSLIFGALAAMAVFYYLYSQKSAGMFHSLPIRRESLFITNYLSGLIWLLASNVLVFLITLLVEASYGMVNITYLLQWLTMVSLANVFFYSFAVFCAMLTGHILVLPLVYAVLNFTAPVVETLGKSLMQGLVYGLTSTGGLKAKVLSPAYYLLSATGTNYTTYIYDGWGALGIYAAIGIIFAVAALLIYRRRHIETASDIVAVRPLKPVFKYCMAAGVALVLGSLILSMTYYGYSDYYYSSFWLMLLCILVCGFIGYFASEMLMKKSFKVFKKGWRGYAVFAIALIALLSAFKLDLFGIESYTPEAKDVESVDIWVGGRGAGGAVLSDAASIEKTIAVHETIIGNKDSYRELALSEDNVYYYNYLYLTYTLKNGKTVSRYYRLYADDETVYAENGYVQPLTDILNSPAAIEARYSTATPVTAENIASVYVSYNAQDGYYRSNTDITSSQAEDLYQNYILPDIRDGNLGKVWLVDDGEYENTILDCYIEIALLPVPEKATAEATDTAVATDTTVAEYISIQLTKDAVRTIAYLEELLGVELATLADAYR